MLCVWLISGKNSAADTSQRKRPMPFYIVYDPPQSNGPFLIGNRPGGKDKEFATYMLAADRMSQIGKAARKLCVIWQFTNLADANSHCITIRQNRRVAVVVTVKKKPPEGGLLAHRAVGQPSVGRPEVPVEPDVSEPPDGAAPPLP